MGNRRKTAFDSIQMAEDMNRSKSPPTNANKTSRRQNRNKDLGKSSVKFAEDEGRNAAASASMLNRSVDTAATFGLHSKTTGTGLKVPQNRSGVSE